MTPQVLAEAWGCPTAVAMKWADPLSAACAFYGIDTPARLAAFLAQTGHESGGGRHVAELWGPTPAQVRYEGRVDLGNVQPGDGARFKGRGLIQTTGRYNHARVRDRLRERFPAAPDFEADPEALTDPQWAALSAADYWDDKGLNALADNGDFERITRRINGGLNGQADRLVRWERAKRALATPATNPIPAAPAGSALSHTAAPPARAQEKRSELSQEPTMPLPLILGALLPSIIDAIPRLGKLFGSGSEVAERNVKAAELAVTIVQQAVGARNAQEAAEMVAADPAIAQVAIKAVEERWFELTEAGGGGIEGAGKRDAAMTVAGDMLRSPSFWVALLLLPLVYMIVGSVVGLFGAPWSDDVRSAIANGVVGMVLGSIAGYYFGQSTSRNRTTAP